MTEILAAFMYFYYCDLANAQIHVSDVKFSPLTFGLADIIEMNYYDFDLREDVRSATKHVVSHKNKYEMDKGR